MVLAAALPLYGDGEMVSLAGLKQPVEILRDKWGVPHIYAKSAEDLFFAQGWVTAKDRLFQIDLWRRINTGKLSEVLGPQAMARDRIARLVRYRGNWDEEWKAYSPDAKTIATSFVAGINAYIKSLKERPAEFKVAGYDPGLWVPEDCVARVAGLLMTRNLVTEVSRTMNVSRFGAAWVEKLMPPDPFVKLELPKGLAAADIVPEIVKDYQEAIGGVKFPDQGSNNWVVDGTRTVTGKPILANDPHRPVQIPSLRKTVHLVAPGWNVIGAGEPALPGIALGHNEEMAFGFTIVGIDQQDLYVEKLNPKNPDEYLSKGQWKRMEIEKEPLLVKGQGEKTIELRYTQHGPVIYEDRARNRAYALRWVGAEPGGAGYLGALAVSRAKTWAEFKKAVGAYKVPSENIVYADRAGNIGWIASGFAPLRKNWTGMFPVPGDSGDYEWGGYLPLDQHPQLYNPPSHSIATANHNILPEGYKAQLSHEWAQPFRHDRIEEMLREPKRFSIEDFQKMQQDVASIPARRFREVVRKWKGPSDGPGKQARQQIVDWDARLAADSNAALLFELWMAQVPAALFDSPLGSRAEMSVVLKTLETGSWACTEQALEQSLKAALKDYRPGLGWGSLHQITFRHPVGARQFDRGPVNRPGDGNTVNATSGTNFKQSSGASYREILDVADWDRSVTTNTPGESGDPSSKHYSDLLDDWANGRYHPLPYSRKAVEAATDERILLTPKR